MPQSTRPSGPSGERQWAGTANALVHPAIQAGPSGEKQEAVSDNALVHSVIKAGPSGEKVRDSWQSVAMPQSTRPSGQALVVKDS